MDRYNLSQFLFYSLGIAADNKHLSSDILHVLPIEITGYGDGELDARLVEFEGKGKDKLNEDYEVKVKQDAAIEARWLRLGHTNKRTPPDVRRGERVALYRHGNSENFFWDSLGMDDHLRRLETVIYSWSDTENEDEDATDPKHCYSLEICTHTQQVTFRTVKHNDEPFEYVLQFNTKEGRVILTDDVDNYIELDSEETRITLQNKDESKIILDKEDITIEAPNNITLKAASINISTGSMDIDEA